jgi:predicted metal-dependent peptidase
MSIKKDFEDTRTLLIVHGPIFLTSLLYRCRIIADPKVKTLGVTNNHELLINPDFFDRLTLASKIFALEHETIHLGFYHLTRMAGKEKKRFNIAADCVVNTILQQFKLVPKELRASIVSADKIAKMTNKPISEIEKLHAEAIYQILERRSDQELKEKIEKIPDDLYPQENNGRSASKQKPEVLQEGDPNFYKDKLNPEEQKKYWEQALTAALMAQKIAGTLPAGLSRILKELTEAIINWKALLKKEIVNGLGKTRITDWRRPSRKHGLLPGVKLWGKPTIWSLVDTSGSISLQKLKQFFSENFHILKTQAKLAIIPWDTKAYNPIIIEKPSQLLVKTEGKIKGGGGTVIGPALEKVRDLMQRQDIVIVFTDGSISDIKKPNIQNLLQKIGRQSNRAIFVTSKTKNPIPQIWKKITIQS